MKVTHTQSPSLLQKTCTKCGITKEISEFQKKAADKTGFASDCKKCHNKHQRDYRKTQKYKDTMSFPRSKAVRKKSQDKYGKTEKSKKRYKKYRNSDKGRASGRRSYHKQKAKQLAEELFLISDIPREVIMPYVQAAVNRCASVSRYKSQGKNQGITALSQMTGVSPDGIRKLLKGDKKGLSLDDCDILAIHSDFTIYQLYEEAEQWAIDNDSEWPIGYIPQGYNKDRPAFSKHKELVYADIRRRKAEKKRLSSQIK